MKNKVLKMKKLKQDGGSVCFNKKIRFKNIYIFKSNLESKKF